MSDTASRHVSVASAPVSFGVDEVIFDDAWMPSPDEMLDWMVELGYVGTELGPPGFMGEADVMRERLSSRGLELVGAFLPQHFSRNDRVVEDQAWLLENLERMREAAPAGSRPFAVLSEAIDEDVRIEYTGRIDSHPEAQLSAVRWDALADNLHAAAELCRTNDLEPVFHPHAGTYIETAAEIDELMGRIDPEIVGLCLDTGHFSYGGADPAQCVRDYAALVRHVHLKDTNLDALANVVAQGGDLTDAVRQGVFRALGDGDASIADAVVALGDIGYEGWVVVEQDQALTNEDTRESLVASQGANREFLRQLGL